MSEGITTAPVTETPVNTATTPVVEEFISPEEFTKLSSKKVKRVIDGKEEVLTLGELEKGYGHSKVANKRFEEAAELRKQVASDKQKLERELSRLRDPEAARQILSQYLGEDGFSNLAHKFVADAFRKEMMTPEQRKADEERRELESLRDLKKQREEEANNAQFQAQVQQADAKITQDLQNLKAKIGRNIHPHEMDTLLSMLSKSLENGVDLSIDEAWAYTHKTTSEQFNRYLNEVDVNNLPKEFVEKVRKASVATLPFQAGKQGSGVTSTTRVKEESMDSKDYFNKIRKSVK